GKEVRPAESDHRSWRRLECAAPSWAREHVKTEGLVGVDRHQPPRPCKVASRIDHRLSSRKLIVNVRLDLDRRNLWVSFGDLAGAIVRSLIGYDNVVGPHRCAGQKALEDPRLITHRCEADNDR